MSSKRAKKRPRRDEFDKTSSDVTNELENDSMRQSDGKLLGIEEMRELIAELDANYITQKKELEICKPQINALCRSTGIYCVKFSSSEFIFDIVIAEDGKPVGTYTVQIFNENDKGVLGRFKIPLGMDIQRILSETPIDNLLNASKFLKNCKHYIDLYHGRKKQFEEFRSYIENAINCCIDTNYNYTIMYLQIIKIHNSETHKYYNLIVYLWYDLANEKPNTIKIDSSNEEELDDTTHTYLKSSLKCFKTLKLKEALIDFEEQNNTPIIWRKKLSDDSLLSSDSIDSSDSEEEEKSSSNIKSKQAQRPIKSTSKSKGRKSTRKTFDENFITSNTHGKLALTNKTRSSRCILVRKNRNTTKKQSKSRILKQSKLSFGVKKNNKVETNRETSSSEHSNECTNDINTNEQNEELECSRRGTANENNLQSEEIDKVQREKTKKNTSDVVTESNGKSPRTVSNDQNKGLESKEKTVENETCKQVERPKSKETMKNVNGKSNFLLHEKKLDLQTVSTSTPLMHKSKSLLKQAMKEHLNIIDISRVECIGPSIPES